MLAAVLAGSDAAAQTQMRAGYDGMAFVEAVRKADGDKATTLLNSHPPGLVNARGGDGQTGLILAVARSDEKWTAFLISKGADPNLSGKDGDTPMIAAARVGFETAVEWLLSAGAKADLANRAGETALIIAVQQREPQIVQLLLNSGANPDRPDNVAGYTARDYAKRDPRARDILKMIETKRPKAGPAAK